MTTTRSEVAAKLREYLQHRLSINELVDWAETMMMDAEFDAPHAELLREVVARLGVADVRNFGLTWEDCQEFLGKLGYQANIEIYPLEPMLRVSDDTTDGSKKSK